MTAPTILLAAGEPSGDLHGAGVARALRARWPDARLFGLGGPRMAAEGVELLADFEDLAVMGFVEVASRLPYFIRLMGVVRREMNARGTQLVIPIDYPGFNLRLARAATEARIPVLYYIAPQVWAWHRSRMKELARVTDRVATILPFEADLLRGAGADARFVGHPLLDLAEAPADQRAFAAQHGLDPERQILAVFPGSRQQEVERHIDVFSEAAGLVARDRPGLQPVIARAPSVLDDAYAHARYPLVVDSHGLLRHARAAIVKSGTTTLEAAIAGVPFVVAYRTHPLTFWLAEHLVEVEHVALANLVAGARVVPELLQDAATPQALAAALGPLVDESPARERVLEGLSGVRQRLESAEADGASTAERVVNLAAELLAGA
ncbi:MAG TPA: lipid-A-disaccharide synthase [Longimicrobiales bacterium]